MIPSTSTDTQAERVSSNALNSDDEDIARSLKHIVGGCKKRQKAAKNAAIEARERLETKLMNKKSLKRVAETLDSIQRERNKRKFNQQFSYALRK